ncbi:unnamed protein product [Dovyalis caffra]|uniref:Erbb2 interacting protein n=1 Tax=Dovyalis caffra TaxID=77055 RepID=A0AAV1RVU5_9ROSI|nr:unnamed protein product [Dovyalis caffra]
MLTSYEMDMTSRGVCLALPPSERDSPGERGSPVMSLAPDRDPQRHRELLRENLPNSGGSSVLSVTDKDLCSQEASLVLPPTAEKDLQEEILPTIPRALERKLSGQEISLATSHTSEGLYVPEPSQWSETPTLTSQRNEIISRTSQRICLPTSPRSNNVAPSSKRTDDGAIDLTSECLYLPTPGENDNMGPSLHKDGSLTPTSRRTDPAVRPASERLYDIITSHFSDGVAQSFGRNDHMFPISERVYSTTTSQRTDNMMPASQRANAIPPTTETMYMPPIVQKNNGAQRTSERPYMPPSERMYSESTLISIDGFSGQGAPMTLAASQRI